MATAGFVEIPEPKKEALVSSVPTWWHSIDLGDGIVTEGHKTREILDRELSALQLPPLAGRSVLDIGTWDGFFAFAAEQRGATRVVALDHFVWAIDWAKTHGYLKGCAEQGILPAPLESVADLWAPDLPGKFAFDVAHQLLGSEVEPIVADFMTVDLETLGRFDVVLYLGVLYHQRHPLLALERLARVTAEVAVIETHAMYVPGLEHLALCEFLELDELGDDHTNWWAPNLRAVVSLCRGAGFRAVEVVQGPPPEVADLGPDAPPTSYRAIVHARP